MDTFQKGSFQYEVLEFKTFGGSNILGFRLALKLESRHTTMHLSLWPGVFGSRFVLCIVI